MDSDKPKRGRPRKGTREKVTERIVDGAMELFLERGFASTNIEDIVTRSGCSRRTLYSRFPSKRELFRAVILKLVQQHFPILEGSVGQGKNLEEKLVNAGKAILESSLTREVVLLHKLLTAEGDKFLELGAIFEEIAWSRTISFLSDLMETEYPRSVVDVDFLADQFLSMVVSSPQRKVSLGADPEKVLRERLPCIRISVRLLLEGCRGLERLRHSPK